MHTDDLAACGTGNADSPPSQPIPRNGYHEPRHCDRGDRNGRAVWTRAMGLGLRDVPEDGLPGFLAARAIPEY